MDSNGSEQAIDREIVASFLGNRSEANFRCLYRKHNPRLLVLARKLTSRGLSSAEDAIQETWLRATRLLPQFGWHSSLSTWLTGILVNVVHELDRAVGPLPTLLNGEEEQGASSAGLEPLESLALVEALQALPPGFRTIVALHDIEGFTHAEISEALGIECGTSKSQLARARQRLRSRLVDLQ